MSQIISKISIKNSSGTGYDTRDIGAKGQNVKVGYDASGKVILDVDSQTPDTTKQLTKVLQDAESNISNLNKDKAPDNHAWSDADSGVNHGLADGTHYGHIKTGNGLTNNAGAVSVAYGTTANTACQGNDSRLSDARPASDVYSWAKASSKPSYSWNEIGSKPSYADQLELSGNTLSSKNSLGSPEGFISGISFYEGNFNLGTFHGGVSAAYISSEELAVDSGGTIKLGDHYVYAEEKGTWTPINTVSGSTDTSVYRFKDSEYRKIGDIVILTTTATPTNHETESAAEPTILGDSFPFSPRHIVSAFATSATGASSIGTRNTSGQFKFGTYNFIGASNGITDVQVTIIYQNRK